MSAAPGLWPGVGMALLAAMLWGSTGTAQSLAPDTLSAYALGSLRLCIAAGFFAILCWAMQRSPHVDAPLDWPRVLFCGACMAAYNLCFFAGLRWTGVALGTALAIGSGPIWAGFMQAWLQRRWPAALWWIGTLTGVSGGVVMALASTAGAPLPWRGMVLCLAAGLAYAGYAVANQALVRSAGAGLGVARCNAWVFLVAALMSLPVALWLGGPVQIDASGWWVVLYLGIVATGVAYWLFSLSLRSLSVATGVALTKGEPVMAFVLSIWIVGERPAWWAALGLAAVVLGLWLVVRSELARSPHPKRAG